MENNKTVVRRCPYCGSPFELVLSDDKLHPSFSLEKPTDFEGDIIERIYDCPNPNCRRPITVYYYIPKRFFDLFWMYQVCILIYGLFADQVSALQWRIFSFSQKSSSFSVFSKFRIFGKNGCPASGHILKWIRRFHVYFGERRQI